MTLQDFLEIGEIRRSMKAYQKKREEAIECCAQLLIGCKNPYLAISGGKDSVAMAFLVNEAALLVNRDFDLWLHMSDASFPGTLETVQVVQQKIKRKLVIYNSPHSAFDSLNLKQKREFGKSGEFFDSIRNYVKTENKDLVFVGTRAYESRRRMKAAKAHGKVFYSESMGGVVVCNPLQWFKLEDVAAALYEFRAPIHPIYSKMETDGGKNLNNEAHWIRLGYITSRDLINLGTAVFLKLNYPDIYAKLCKAYPEIKSYT